LLWGLIGLSVAMAIVLFKMASNTASAIVIIPVVIHIDQGVSVSSLPPALGLM
jgi:di/tricarboxylate transporter